MTEPQITDHVWRPRFEYGHNVAECGYLNCGRPRADHERAVQRVARWPEQRSGEPT
jgi:hypothetical protein